MKKEFQDKIVHDVLILGPGGCGKSAFANAWAEKITEGHEDHIGRVLISENMSFDTFFGGYRPVTIKDKKDNEEKITYQFIPGFFFKMYLEAKMNPDDNYVLIVEEINRGDAYNIFGDVFQLLDRKKKKDEEGEKNESEYGVSISESAADFIVDMINKESDEYGLYFGVKVQREKIDELKKIVNYVDDKKNRVGNTVKIKMPNNMYIIATANMDIVGGIRLDSAFLRRFSNIYMNLEGKVYGRPYDRHVLKFVERKYEKYKVDYTPGNEESTIKENDFEDFRKYINGVILKDPYLCDDKLLSKHFIEMDESDGNKYLHNEDFIINVLKYLKDNVFRDKDGFESFVFSGFIDKHDSWEKIKECWLNMKIS